MRFARVRNFFIRRTQLVPVYVSIKDASHSRVKVIYYKKVTRRH